MASSSVARLKERLVVNLLLTAPGKWTLQSYQLDGPHNVLIKAGRHTGLSQAAARPWIAIFAGIERICCCLGGLFAVPFDAMVRVIVWTPFWLSGELQRSHS
jgi:hypothetical protein